MLARTPVRAEPLFRKLSMSSTWQIKVGQNLSKPYTLEQLRTKRRNGTIDDATECTHDRGESFTSLTELLDGELELASPVRRLSRPGSKSGASRLKKALPSTDEDEPLLDLGAETADSLPLPPEPDERQPPATAPTANRNLFEGLSGAYRSVLNATQALPAESLEAPDERLPSGPTFDLAANSPAPSDPPAHPVHPAANPAGQRPPAQPMPGRSRGARPPVQSGIDTAPGTSVRNAAAQAIAAQAARADGTEAAADDLSRAVPGQRPGQTSVAAATTDRPRRPRISSMIVMVAGVTAVGLLIWWMRSGSPSVEDLTGGSFSLAETNGETLSLEELSARTQILGVQLSRVTRVLANRDAAAEPIELPELPSARPRLPLMPFHAETLSDSDTSRSADFQSRYTKLVQEQGPDGSRLDDAVVTRYSGYLTHLAQHAGSEGATRAEALYKLSEWTKLLYLMQFGRLSSSERSIVRQAQKEVLDASNAGLATIFPELASGDMRFVDVFERASDAEQARLLLVRFWYYRADNPEYAHGWLEESLQQLDEQHHADVRASIAEVEQIIAP